MSSDLSTLTEKTIGGLKIRPVTERSPNLNVLIYGDPGIGKTRLAGSASLVPDMSPVLVVDVEGGVLSLADTYPDVESVRIDSWESMQEVYSELYDDPSRYRTIIIDSLTEMQKFSMDKIMLKAVAKNADRDVEVPGMREWGINGEQIRRLVRGFRDMDINAIFTCLALEDIDDAGITRVKPALSGKLKNEVAGFVDIVSYMYRKRVKTEDNERYVGTFLLNTGTDKQVAKDRTGRLPEVMEDPTMAEMYGYISGKQTKETE